LSRTIERGRDGLLDAFARRRWQRLQLIRAYGIGHLKPRWPTRPGGGTGRRGERGNDG
jgi:hypothetical protein